MLPEAPTPAGQLTEEPALMLPLSPLLESLSGQAVLSLQACGRRVQVASAPMLETRSNLCLQQLPVAVAVRAQEVRSPEEVGGQRLVPALRVQGRPGALQEAFEQYRRAAGEHLPQPRCVQPQEPLGQLIEDLF